MPKLFLIRGLPGSGKSTLAQQMTTGRFYTSHYEADMFFLEDGEYKFDVSKLGRAHDWCRTSTAIELRKGNTVIVSNTFTTLKELRPYFELAKEHGIIPTVIHCQNHFNSVHSVPEETMQKMRSRWDNNLQLLFEEFQV